MGSKSFSIPNRKIRTAHQVSHHFSTVARQHGAVFEGSLTCVLQEVVRLTSLELLFEAVGILRLRCKAVSAGINVGKAIGSRFIYCDDTVIGM